MSGKNISLTVFITGLMVIAFLYITSGEFMNIINDIIPTVVDITDLESIVLRLIFPICTLICLGYLIVKFNKRRGD